MEGALQEQRKGEDESSCLFLKTMLKSGNWNARMKAKHAPFIPSHSVCQDSRKSGLRALMIYPLNALVDDQMRRLRFALDSKEMHELYNKHFSGHTPRFARYNSSTIGGTSRIGDKDKLDTTYRGQQIGAKIRTEIEMPFIDMYEAMNGFPPEVGSLMSSVEAKEGRDPEDGFIVQNPYGCEQRFRWDIQHCVPDILVTNLSLLQVLAARTTTADDESLIKL